MDLVDDFLEAFGSCSHSDLREEGLGDVDGTGLAVVPEGEVVRGVQRAAVVAGAGSIAASVCSPA